MRKKVRIPNGKKTTKPGTKPGLKTKGHRRAYLGGGRLATRNLARML